MKLDPARMQLISGFVDVYLNLNGTEEELFQVTANNMGLLQEEKYMEIVTSWERKARQEGIQEGVQQGIQQGVQEAQETIAINLLRRGMGAEETREITGLSLERVRELQGRLSQDN
ncbi:RpnC/YadD family protein [Anabaenopsis elenkinii]|uniref:Transposase n=1 Tax=Anabaenopsis elenkinii CCIBt3563 TaxID=2779889 RepID=A0A7S6TZD2_9CYAN|nr:hypothetical protein [Anabaenopsis elenkinii]QOV22665.1 hypothetical protein IM676_18780 [Anabaenopsis elenkinii CCIBt3563]